LSRKQKRTCSDSEYLLDRVETVEDLDVAERAIAAIEIAARVQLLRTPFIYRKAAYSDELRREQVWPSGISWSRTITSGDEGNS